MKPALSVIFFTVSSGAGLGLAVWLLLAQLGGQVQAAQPAYLGAVLLSGVLLTAGLLSSTAHLANPRNAWRAFSRFGSSWLSREGVLAVAFYPLAALHLWFVWQRNAAWHITAALLIALALAIVLCTAMIYACLKTVPRWRTWHTPVAYLLHALASGGLLWLAVAAHDKPRGGTVMAIVALILAALLVKLAFYAKFSKRVHHTLNEAMGVPLSAAPGRVQGRVRLLDAGHTHGTFLTSEFGFELARERAAGLRGLMFVIALAVALLLAGLGAERLGPAGLAVLAAVYIGGLLIERWLFFAQAEHVVRLYHGQSQV